MKKSSLKQHPLKILSLFLVIIFLSILAIAYWLYEQAHPSTNDAYVQANVVYIAPQVSGPVQQIFVKNHEQVKKDQLLFTIDPRPFQDAVDKAKAVLKIARQQEQSEEEAIHIAADNLAQAKATLTDAQSNYNRTKILVRKGQASLQDGDDTKAAFEEAKAALSAAQNQLKQAIANLGEKGDANATVQQAKAELAQAKLNLSYTNVTAPVNGYLTNFSLRLGSTVQTGQTLFQLVDPSTWWLEANYKETDIARIKIGQHATIRLDMYPSHVFNGVVDSISRGSGSSFSVLPPENATGNWVKVTQRFQVKVVLTNPSKAYPLRIGASAVVNINTRTP